MPSIVLRVAGVAFDVDAFLAAHADVDVDAVWREGVLSPPGRKVPTTSGFNACLGDDDDTTTAMSLMRASLGQLGPSLRAAIHLGASACVDIGLFVGAEFTQTVHLTSADLVLFTEHGISLEVSAYPCSPDE